MGESDNFSNETTNRLVSSWKGSSAVAKLVCFSIAFGTTAQGGLRKMTAETLLEHVFLALNDRLRAFSALEDVGNAD